MKNSFLIDVYEDAICYNKRLLKEWPESRKDVHREINERIEQIQALIQIEKNKKINLDKE